MGGPGGATAQPAGGLGARLIRLIKEIKFGIIEASNGNAIMVPRINEALDIDMIKRRYNSEEYMSIEEWKKFSWNCTKLCQ